ncbi:MAG: hypothetical protein AAGI01_07035 [Myxococcota bacterium]
MMTANLNMVRTPPRTRELLDTEVTCLAMDFEARGFVELDVPSMYTFEGQWAKSPLKISPRAWRGGAWPYVRVVRVDGGDAVQVLNMVWFPSEHTAAPVFGCELLVFRRGVHLVVFDLFATDSTHEPTPPRAILRELRGAWSAAAGELPEWGEEVFSEDAMILKPGTRTSIDPSSVLPSRHGLSRALLECDASSIGDKEAHSARLKTRARFIDVQGRNDPAAPFLERIAGHTWTHAFVDDVLYPTWLLGSSLAPSW